MPYVLHSCAYFLLCLDYMCFMYMLLCAEFMWCVFMCNISAMSWRSVLLVEEYNRSVESHWQILLHNVLSSTPRHELNQVDTIVIIQIYVYTYLTYSRISQPIMKISAEKVYFKLLMHNSALHLGIMWYLACRFKCHLF